MVQIYVFSRKKLSTEFAKKRNITETVLLFVLNIKDFSLKVSDCCVVKINNVVTYHSFYQKIKNFLFVHYSCAIFFLQICELKINMIYKNHLCYFSRNGREMSKQYRSALRYFVLIIKKIYMEIDQLD